MWRMRSNNARLASFWIVFEFLFVVEALRSSEDVKFSTSWEATQGLHFVWFKFSFELFVFYLTCLMLFVYISVGKEI